VAVTPHSVVTGSGEDSAGGTLPRPIAIGLSREYADSLAERLGHLIA
jgi:hypothetical protein